jgi:hypothetical protein
MPERVPYGNTQEPDAPRYVTESSQQAYALALDTALDELDRLLPAAKKLNDRIALLRTLVRSASCLLDRDVDEKYQKPKTLSYEHKR